MKRKVYLPGLLLPMLLPAVQYLVSCSFHVYVLGTELCPLWQRFPGTWSPILHAPLIPPPESVQCHTKQCVWLLCTGEGQCKATPATVKTPGVILVLPHSWHLWLVPCSPPPNWYMIIAQFLESSPRNCNLWLMLRNQQISHIPLTII